MDNSTIVIGVVNFETIAEKVTGIECGIKITCINNCNTVVQSCNIFEHWKIVFRINFIFTIIFVAMIVVIMVMIVVMAMIVVMVMIIQSESEGFCNLKVPF